jgi:hypothetical protein
LVGGTLRLRLTARAVAELPHACAKADHRSIQAVERRADGLLDWYRRLAIEVGRPTGDLHPLAESQLTGAGEATAEPDAADDGSRAAIWLREHLEHLAEHAPDLAAPASRIAEIRRQPWWR